MTFRLSFARRASKRLVLSILVTFLGAALYFNWPWMSVRRLIFNLKVESHSVLIPEKGRVEEVLRVTYPRHAVLVKTLNVHDERGRVHFVHDKNDSRQLHVQFAFGDSSFENLRGVYRYLLRNILGWNFLLIREVVVDQHLEGTIPVEIDKLTRTHPESIDSVDVGELQKFALRIRNDPRACRAYRIYAEPVGATGLQTENGARIELEVNIERIECLSERPPIVSWSM